VGFGLLGYIVEEVSGISFNTYCQTHILDPLGMRKSGWFLHEVDTLAHIRPYSYQAESEYNKALNLYSFPNYPDGLLRTSVRELSYFLMAIIQGGVYKDARILKEASLKKMLTVQLEGSGQGLCWNQTGFESLWGHSGGDPGVATYMYFSPQTKIGVIVFQNNHNGDLFNVFRKLYNTATADL
jgi:CubicO group peptidase (beta-lactamase class C family)